MKRENPTKLPERNLDVLRAIAVSCVVADHVLMVTVGNQGRDLSWSLGMFGVYCFFVHTSLVLMASLERQCGRGGVNLPSAVAFYVRRGFRVVPLVWAVLALVILLHVPPFPTDAAGSFVTTYLVPTWREIIANAAVAQNLAAARDLQGPLWSLPIEMQMYLLLPALFIMARRSVAAVVLALVVGAGLATWYAHGGADSVHGMWRLTIILYTPCFLSGVLAYALLRRFAPPPRVPATAFPLLVLAAFAVFAVAARNRVPEWGWLACLLLGLGISAVREQLPNNGARVAKSVATYSYGVYLLHVPALWIAFIVMRNAPTLLQWGAFALLMFALPYLAYRFIERPGIELGQRIVHRRPITQAATAPAP